MKFDRISANSYLATGLSVVTPVRSLARCNVVLPTARQDGKAQRARSKPGENLPRLIAMTRARALLPDPAAFGAAAERNGEHDKTQNRGEALWHTVKSRTHPFPFKAFAVSTLTLRWRGRVGERSEPGWGELLALDMATSLHTPPRPLPLRFSGRPSPSRGA